MATGSWNLSDATATPAVDRLPRVHGPAILALVSIVAMAVLLAVEHEHLRANGRGAAFFALGCGICLAVRFAPGKDPGGRWRVARDLAEYVGLFSAFAMIGAIASYPDAAASSGWADALLERADRLLRFDWVHLYLLTARHPAIQTVGAIAYQSIYAIPGALLIQFACTGRRAEAHRFLLCFWLAAVGTLLLFRWLPAAGPLAFLWKGPIPYMPQSALYQARLIPLLQQHRLRVVDIDALHGLVSAPSFHAASGTLFILFARKMPRIGPPLIGLSLLMLAATPVEGTHYLVDIVAGMLIASSAYGVTRLPQLRWLWDRVGIRPAGRVVA